MFSRLLVVVVACSCLLVLPHAASAASLTADATGITLTDSANEANAVTISRSGDVITVEDSVALDVPLSFVCERDAIDTGRAECTFPAGTGADQEIVVDAGNGADTVTITADNYAELDGGAGFDELTGGPQGDLIVGGAEGDTMHGGEGDDELDGGDGTDTVSGGPGGDTFTDTVGDFDVLTWSNDGLTRPDGIVVTVDAGVADTDGAPGEGDEVGAGFYDFVGSEGDDQITGSDEDEAFFGGEGVDELDGGGGDDVLSASAGADSFDGGSHIDGDTVRYSRFDSTAPVRVTIDDEADDGLGGGAEGDDVQTTVERVTGTEGADVLVGSTGDDELDGRNGDDSIDGGAGQDTLIGYFGADTIQARDDEADTVVCGQVGEGNAGGEDDGVAVDGGGVDTVDCQDVDFVDDAEDPEFSGIGPVDVLSEMAFVTGMLDANGGETSYRFEYGTTTAYGSQLERASIGDSDDPESVGTWVMDDLEPDTTYHYRIVADRGGERFLFHSADHTFTTAAATGGGPAVPPGVATLAAAPEDVGARRATLRGTVDPNGATTSWRFDYGTSPIELDRSTPASSAGAGDGDVPISRTVTGLAPNTIYFFRAIALRNDDVVATGDVRQLLTLDAPPASENDGSSSGSSSDDEDPPSPLPPPPAPRATPPADPGAKTMQGNFTPSGPAHTTEQGIPTPDFRPEKAGGRWTITALDDAKTELSALGLNVDLTIRRVGDAGVPDELLRDDSFERLLDPNDVVDQAPVPERVKRIRNAVKGDDLPGFRITVYDPSLDRRLDRALDAPGCAYARRDATGALLRETLANLPLRSADRTGAADRLGKEQCTWEIASVVGDVTATDRTARRATVTRERRTGIDGRQDIVGLHITEPKPPPTVWKPDPTTNANAGAELNLTLSVGDAGRKMSFAQGEDDYELTAAGGSQSFRVTPMQRTTSHLAPPETRIELFYARDGERGDGTFLGSKVTRDPLGVQFEDIELRGAGKLVIKASYTGPSGDGTANVVMGTRTVRVVQRPDDGCVEWRRVDGVLFRPNRQATGCHSYSAVTGQASTADFWDVFGPLSGALRQIFTGSAQAAQTGTTATGQPAGPAPDQNGIKPCSLDDAKRNSAQPPPAGQADAFVITPNGTVTAGSVPAVATSDGAACGITGKGVYTHNAQWTTALPLGAPVLHHNGGKRSPIQVFDEVQRIISNDGAGVIATGGGNVIATGGGNLRPLAEKIAAVIATGGGNLSADQVLTLWQKPDGSLRSGAEIASVIATGGGNVIATGGGNLISDKGLGLTTQGGGNLIPTASNTAGVIATGGGNLSADDVGRVIATGGGNLHDGITVGVIATGGGNFSSADVMGLIGQAGGNLMTKEALDGFFNAAALIGQAGGNFAADPEKTMTVMSDSMLTNVESLIGQAGGNLIGQAGGNVISTGGGNVIATGGGN